MDAQTIEALADRLIAAEESRTPVEVLSVDHPHMTVADGYRIQLAIAARKQAAGDRVVGKKIGLTSRANQEVFGVHEPVCGQLMGQGVYLEGTPIDTAALIQPIIECEITFVMGRRIEGPGATVPQVLRATEGLMPSLELGDSRMRDWIGRATVADILADSCGTAGIIVGGRTAFGAQLRHAVHGDGGREGRRRHRDGRRGRGDGQPGAGGGVAGEQARRARAGDRGGRTWCWPARSPAPCAWRRARRSRRPSAAAWGPSARGSRDRTPSRRTGDTMTAPADLVALLETHRFGHLATADKGGAPHLVPVCFAYDGQAVYSAIDHKPKRRAGYGMKRIRNILENRNVAFLVHHYEEDWRRLYYVMMRGPAAILEAGDERARAFALLEGKYDQYRERRLGAGDGLVVKLVPERITRWGEAGTVEAGAQHS